MPNRLLIPARRREQVPDVRVAHSEAPSRRAAAPAPALNSRKPSPIASDADERRTTGR